MRVGVFGSRTGGIFGECLYRRYMADHPHTSYDFVVSVSNGERPGIREAAELYLVPHYAPRNDERFEAEALQILRDHRVDTLMCIGYMRVLSPWFLSEWRRFGGLACNLHPAPLSFPGPDPFEAMVKAEYSVVGPTVHFITEKLDSGPEIWTKTEWVDKSDRNAETFRRITRRMEPDAVDQALNRVAKMRTRLEERDRGSPQKPRVELVD